MSKKQRKKTAKSAAVSGDGMMPSGLYGRSLVTGDMDSAVLPVFLIGYWVGALEILAADNQELEVLEPALLELDNALESAVDIPKHFENCQRAIQMIRQQLESIPESGASNRISIGNAIHTMSRILNSAGSVEGVGEREPIRGWFIIGLRAGWWDKGDETEETWVPSDSHLQKTLLTKEAVQNFKASLGSSTDRLGDVKHWLGQCKPPIWVPPGKSRKASFNGRELTEAEYDVLIAIYKYGRACSVEGPSNDDSKGLTTQELVDTSGRASAANSLSELRRWPETKEYISGKGEGPVRFVREVPPPPDLQL